MFVWKASVAYVWWCIAEIEYNGGYVWCAWNHISHMCVASESTIHWEQESLFAKCVVQSWEWWRGSVPAFYGFEFEILKVIVVFAKIFCIQT